MFSNLYCKIFVSKFSCTLAVLWFLGDPVRYNSEKCSVAALFLFSVSWVGVRPSPLVTSATNRPIVPAPDDRWWWMWSSRWNENWQGKPKYSEKTCPKATLSTTNPTWFDLGSNPGRCGGKPATNSLSYGTAFAAPLGNEFNKRYLFTVVSSLGSHTCNRVNFNDQLVVCFCCPLA
jgi:hypothetical protein